MKIKTFIILSIFCLEQKITAGPKKSICENLQKYCSNLFIAFDIQRARYEMSDDEIICKSAEFKNPHRIKYCIDNNIGDPTLSINDEGHTPRSIAKLLGNKKIVKIIGQSPTSITRKKHN